MRVIDVAGTYDSFLRLMPNTDSNQSEQYTALSYCLEGPQRLKLVSSNVGDLERGFPLGELPETIREAVQVTREMGTRYHCVDSICIMQDSVED